MEIGMMTLGALGTNCYLVYGEKKTGILIDPADSGDTIIQCIKAEGVDVKYIVLTHGHFDHIGALRQVQAFTGAQIAIHEKDAYRLPRADREAALFGMPCEAQPRADVLLHDGDEIKVDDLLFRVLFTPGHTEGSICLLGGKALFTGDTLFCGNVGRTDLPGGSLPWLETSLARLAALEGNYAVYPGHGDVTNLDTERRQNPAFMA